MTVEQQIKDAKKLLGLHPGCRIVCKRKPKAKAKTGTKTLESVKNLEGEVLRKAEKANYIIRTQKENKIRSDIEKLADKLASALKDDKKDDKEVERLKKQYKQKEDEMYRYALTAADKLDKTRKELKDEKERVKVLEDEMEAVETYVEHVDEPERLKRIKKDKEAELQRDVTEAMLLSTIQEIEQNRILQENILEESLPKKTISDLEEYMRGSGSVGTGMSDHELDEIMKDEPYYQKCISIDEIHTLKPEPKMEFIMNKSPSTTEGSHWVACYIDTKDECEVDYYDPLADPPQEEFTRDIKSIIDKLNPDKLLKFKINSVRNQKNSTDTCGIQCVNFLRKRNRGISFKDATGYVEPKIDNSDKYEAEARKIRKQSGFGFI